MHEYTGLVLNRYSGRTQNDGVRADASGVVAVEARAIDWYGSRILIGTVSVEDTENSSFGRPLAPANTRSHVTRIVECNQSLKHNVILTCDGVFHDECV